MNQVFCKRCFRIDRSVIAYLRFLVEAYDGLLFLRTLDPQTALVEIAYSPACRNDAEALLAALVTECGLCEEPFPPDLPPL